MERVRPAVGAGVGVTAALAAVLLAGCSTVVQPKNASAAVAPSTSVSSSASATPSATPTPTPTVAGKDVDKTVCAAVRTDIATAKDKAETDKASPKKAGTDLKTLGSLLRTQATKTKVTQLKSTLTTLGTEYQTLGTDTAAGKSTTTDESKIADNGAKLDELCAEKPTS